MKMCSYLILSVLFFLISCGSGNPDTEQQPSSGDTSDLIQAEQMTKTDKQRQDSVKAYWENKMNQSDVGEDDADEGK